MPYLITVLFSLRVSDSETHRIDVGMFHIVDIADTSDDDFNFDQLALYLDMLAGWNFENGRFVNVKRMDLDAPEDASDGSDSDTSYSYNYDEELEESSAAREELGESIVDYGSAIASGDEDDDNGEDGKTISDYDPIKDCVPLGRTKPDLPDFGGSFILDFKKELQGEVGVPEVEGDAIAIAIAIASSMVNYILEDVELEILVLEW